MIYIIPIMLPPDMSICLNILKLIFFWKHAIMNARAAPRAPASVGVQSPNSIPPITKRMTTSRAPTSLRAISFSLAEVLVLRGPALGFTLHQIRITMTYSPAISNPGMIPDMRSVPMDVPVIMPYTMNMDEGGIRSPNSEPAAIEPNAIFLSYL